MIDVTACLTSDMSGYLQGLILYKEKLQSRSVSPPHSQDNDLSIPSLVDDKELHTWQNHYTAGKR